MEHSLEIRACDEESEIDTIFSLINRAAAVYEGRIPDELWKDPFISHDYLQAELGRDVRFLGAYQAGVLRAVMGRQVFSDCALIRHAYVDPPFQRQGLASQLLESTLSSEPSMGVWLVGCLRAMGWAIHFYQKHGFQLVSESERDELRRRYWRLSDAHVRQSVVLRQLRPND